MAAPLAVKVAVLPEQMVALLTATVGVVFTLMVPVAVLVQPRAEVPVTVYTVSDVGEAVKEDVAAPVFHE